MESWNTQRHATWIHFDPLPSEKKNCVSPRDSMPGKNKSHKRRQHTEENVSPPRNTLIELCQSKDWIEVMKRSRSHPQEAEPVIAIDIRNRLIRNASNSSSGVFSFGDRTVFQETALGFVCSSRDIANQGMHEVILALVVSNPFQVRTSQLVPGHTPLRDAVLNPLCTTQILKTLIDSDMVCSRKDPRGTSALCKKDRNGLTPVEHLIMGIQLGSPCQSMDLLQALLTPMFSAEGIPSESVSPLIRLLTMGTSFGVRYTSTRPTPWKTTNSMDLDRLDRILLATKALLREEPDLLFRTSRITGCSPLHVALRNYGNFMPLIRQLVHVDADGRVLKQRNKYGDLPIHVACSVGVPMDVLHLILKRTLEVSTRDSQLCGTVDPLVWSKNSSGYTPVDLEWIRHIESGNGFFSARSFYPLEPASMIKHCFKLDEYYWDLLREAVDDVKLKVDDGNDLEDNESTSTVATSKFGTLIDRLTVLLLASSRSSLHQRNNSVLHGVFKLSTPYGPNLPLPLVELFLWMYPSVVDTRDEDGFLPIHYLLASTSASSMANMSVSKSTVADWRSIVFLLLSKSPKSLRKSTAAGRLPLHLVLDHTSVKQPIISELSDARHQVVQELVRKFPESVDLFDPVTGLPPFLLATTDRNLPFETLYSLLRHSPAQCCTQAI